MLPASRLIPLLHRDLRLAVLLPATGAPLCWQLLLGPPACEQHRAPGLAGGRLLEPPLLDRLLAGRLGAAPAAGSSWSRLVRRCPAPDRQPAAAAAGPAGALLQPAAPRAAGLTLQSRWDAAALWDAGR